MLLKLNKLSSVSFLVIVTSYFVASCSSTQLSEGSKKVRIIKQDPTGCEYLGEVTGDQGNFFTGGFTSNANLEVGARNDMKNKAFEMGGDTIVLLSDRAGVTGQDGGSQQQTNVVYTGTVYKCEKTRKK